MREIKFRFWHKEKNKMFDVGQIDWKGFVLNKMGNHTLDSIWKSPNEIELMQFTGLLDKAGVEIYEGDIVKGWLPDTEKDEEFGQAVIKYEGAGFALYRTLIPKPVNKGLYFGDLESCTLNKSIEVIGNVYENADLLKL